MKPSARYFSDSLLTQRNSAEAFDHLRYQPINCYSPNYLSSRSLDQSASDEIEPQEEARTESQNFGRFQGEERPTQHLLQEVATLHQRRIATLP